MIIHETQSEYFSLMQTRWTQPAVISLHLFHKS